MILSFDIGGSKIKAAEAQAGAIRRLGAVPTPTQSIADFVTALRSFVQPEVRGLSLSIAGIIDPATGMATIANIPCLHGQPLSILLAQALGLPVLVHNDADCFALAEARQGAGRGARVVFGVILGTGVGGGIVLDGRVHQGAGGFAGEWGHGPVIQHPALPCGCGQRGCLDTIGGARGIERLHLALTGESLPSRSIAQTRPTTMARWLDLVSGQLAMVVNLLAPDVIPIGGGLGNDADLVARLDLALRQRILRRSEAPLVVPAQCGSDAGLIGAAEAGLAAFCPAMT